MGRGEDRKEGSRIERGKKRKTGRVKKGIILPDCQTMNKAVKKIEKILENTFIYQV